MNACKYILFDCMETLVDLTELPNMRDYAAWGYEGSGEERLWSDFDEYFRYYLLARADIASRLPEHQECNMLDRFVHTVRLSFPEFDAAKVYETACKLDRNYWGNYRTMCFVKEDVSDVLPQLAGRYKLGVVSNFMVSGGIEELLEAHEIITYFDFVVTSIAEGWKKPHPAIYKTAIDRFGARPEEVIFVGDDFLNDYVAPAGLGMKPVYLDRYGKHPEIIDRVSDFHQLKSLLL